VTFFLFFIIGTLYGLLSFPIPGSFPFSPRLKFKGADSQYSSFIFLSSPLFFLAFSSSFVSSS